MPREIVMRGILMRHAGLLGSASECALTCASDRRLGRLCDGCDYSRADSPSTACRWRGTGAPARCRFCGMFGSSALRSATALWNCSSAMLKARQRALARWRHARSSAACRAGCRPPRTASRSSSSMESQRRAAASMSSSRSRSEAVVAALVLFQVAREPCADRAHRRQAHQPPPDVIAVAVEEGFLLAVDKGRGARMHRDRGILVGVGRLDLGGQREFRHHRLPDREQLAGEGGDRRFRQVLARHDVVREADGLDLFLGPVGRAAEGAGGNFGGFVDRMILRDRLGRIDRQECRRAAVMRRGRDRIRGDLAVDRPGGEIGVGLLVADRVGELRWPGTGRYRPWPDRRRIAAGSP